MTKPKKKHKSKDKIKMRKKRVNLPNNEEFWLLVTKNSEEIMDFFERGNVNQKKSLKAVIDYRLWQIQEGKIDKDFFGELDVAKLDFDSKTDNLNSKKVSLSRTVYKTEKKTKPATKKPIDLFDMSNIEDLTKEGK